VRISVVYDAADRAGLERIARGRMTPLKRMQLPGAAGVLGGDTAERLPTRALAPVLLTVGEAAELLRTTRRAIYVMVERHQLPGLIRIGRRLLFRADDLLDWLDQKRAPSSKEQRR
jgi:excisionase family DNA binding protein